MVQEGTQTNPTPGQRDQAKEHFDRALRLVKQARLGVNPEDRRSAFTAAASEFEKALAADPRYPGARTNLGYCFIELGRYGDAKNEIEQAMGEFPQDASARVNYAIILKHNERIQEAESCLRQAIALDPRQGAVFRDLAYLLEERGQSRRAADYLEHYLELTPHANDERSVRSRVILLRQRAGLFELPDRWLTHLGVSADLRRRGAAALWDGMIYAALWPIVARVCDRIGWLDFRQLPLFLSLIYLYHVMCIEALGGSAGKVIASVRVKSDAEASWYGSLTVRETLRIGPMLICLLLPLPWNIVPVLLFVILAMFSALRNREGRTWYDRLTRCHVIESSYGRGRIAALLVCLLCLIGAVLSGFF
jgi:hypothetical protein